MDRRLKTPRNPYSIYGVKNRGILQKVKTFSKTIFYLPQDVYICIHIYTYVCLLHRFDVWAPTHTPWRISKVKFLNPENPKLALLLGFAQGSG